jgi:DNA mismatch repair protein MutL
VYQIFGKETLDQMLPLAAAAPLARIGLPQPPPWRRTQGDEDQEREPGEIRVHGFVSKPEVQKLNRGSMYVFVNQRLIRDRLVQHALTEAYRNILPPTVYPVVLLFLELPPAEVDVNVHPSKTEVRFRQQTVVHDFVRDSVRAALVKARPVPQFAAELRARPSATPSLSARTAAAGQVEASAWQALYAPADLNLRAQEIAPQNERLQFADGIVVDANAAIPVARFPRQTFAGEVPQPEDGCRDSLVEEEDAGGDLAALATLRPLGQVRNSFILAVNEEGLWIVDQHVAHERVLFEKVLRQRAAQRMEGQRLLMPLLIELTPAQQAVFAEIAEELAGNGFEMEPFGSRTVAVKTAPAGIEAGQVERMLQELLDQFASEQQALNLEKARGRIAASIACHAAIKVNMPLEQNKMEWLLGELAGTECPMTCPHGRPVVLRYSVKEIERAFKRI